MAQCELIHPGPVSADLLTRQHEHHSELVWNGHIIQQHLRLHSGFKLYWDIVAESPPVIQGIRDADFESVFLTGTMRHNAGLITAFIGIWCPKTHTFHLRFGEATVTLEDVYYILGLRSSRSPVSFIEREVFDASSVHDVLGVAPVPSVIVSKNIKISWLVREFGSWTLLEKSSGPDFDDQLLFHIHAHLLLIIGSLFPNSSGNRISLHLLPYMRDLDQIGTFSWGSACLAYLYSRLCISSLGNVVELCGPMTLLQVWIYEHCTRLAPKHRGNYIIRHPRALRWMVPVEAVHVQRHSYRGEN